MTALGKMAPGPMGSPELPKPPLEVGSKFVGYEVTWRGLAVGLVEAGVLGFALGGAIAGIANALVGLAERALRRELEAERRIDPFHGTTP